MKASGAGPQCAIQRVLSGEGGEVGRGQITRGLPGHSLCSGNHKKVLRKGWHHLQSRVRLFVLLPGRSVKLNKQVQRAMLRPSPETVKRPMLYRCTFGSCGEFYKILMSGYNPRAITSEELQVWPRPGYFLQSFPVILCTTRVENHWVLGKLGLGWRWSMKPGC